MDIVAWIVLGLVVGFLAKLIHPSKGPGGCVGTILLGVGGAMIGGYISRRLGYGEVTGFDIRSIGIAVGGAFLLLVVARMLSGKDND